MSTMDPEADKTHVLKTVAFNCYGLKSSLPYVKELLNDHDIVFISEHWLLPGEIKILADRDLKTELSHLKSSVDPTKVISGRPHGGCGFE